MTPYNNFDVKVLKKIPEELDQFEGSLVIAVVGRDEKPLKSTNAWLDWRVFGSMTEVIVRGLFKGELGEKCLIPTYGKFSFERLVMLGGGDLFDDSAYPTSSEGKERWMKIGAMIEETAQSLKVEKVGLSLPRFDLIDQERAVLQSLQASPLRADTSFFLARAHQNFNPAGFNL